MARMKVFGGLIHTARGQCRTIVAATSRAKAAEVTGCTIGEMRNWWSETGNSLELVTALQKPGQVFMASSSMGYDFRPVVRVGPAWVDADMTNEE